MTVYYRLRPAAAPRASSSRCGARTAAARPGATFPRWPSRRPCTTSTTCCSACAREVAGNPVPYLAPWPGGHRWALVLTHDVETEVGYRNLHLLRDEEERAGVPLVVELRPDALPVGADVVSDLTERGFEVGVHGLYHDGRDLGRRELLDERLPAMREHAAPLGRRRLPVARDAPRLGADAAARVRLRLVLPGHRPVRAPVRWLLHVAAVLQRATSSSCRSRCRRTTPCSRSSGAATRRRGSRRPTAIRERGGMALLITHPDYMLEPALASRVRPLPGRLQRRPDRLAGAARATSAHGGGAGPNRRSCRDGDGWRVDRAGRGRGPVALAEP